MDKIKEKIKEKLEAIRDPVIEYHYNDDPTMLYRAIIRGMRQLAAECLELIKEPPEEPPA